MSRHFVNSTAFRLKSDNWHLRHNKSRNQRYRFILKIQGIFINIQPCYSKTSLQYSSMQGTFRSYLPLGWFYGLKALSKSNPRNKEARFTMAELAETSEELTIELHLGAFAVAMGLILAFQVPLWVGSWRQFMRRQSRSEISGIVAFVLDASF